MGASTIPIWKRTFDVIAAGLAMLVLVVPFALIALIVRAKMGKPVFFRQVRIGVGAAPFEVVKFRTMLDTRSADGRFLEDEKRVTSFGRFLRASSLDELPELWNILRGDMSFVGPRPLLPEYLPFYLDSQARRHEVRPGLTGLAQVSGRNAQSWDERFALDLNYVDNLSIALDIRILFKTILSVLSREGINAEGHETMPRFDEQVKAGLATGRLPDEVENE
jgi:sugar transferase EpsL